MSELINKVAQSALITLNLEEYIQPGERVMYDIKDNLYMGLMLKEKDFRAFVKDNDWSIYQDKNVAITCTTDAIVPTWAYMLVASKLQPYARRYFFGTLEELDNYLFKEAIDKIDASEYQDAKLVIKGCGQIPIPPFAYVAIMQKLLPVAASIMYGEPCSTVPIYKKPKARE